MRVRSYAAILVGTAALTVARPSMAGQDRATTTTTGASLMSDVQRVTWTGLLLASIGLERLGWRHEAAAVSRHLVVTADDPVDACIAQAGVVWQTAESSLAPTTFTEAARLRRMVSDVGGAADASAADVEVCRSLYRRVMGELIFQEQRAFHCGPYAVVRAENEKLLALYRAYWAIQPGGPSAGALTR
jgi:hypothetical protein